MAWCLVKDENNSTFFIFTSRFHTKQKSWWANIKKIKFPPQISVGTKNTTFLIGLIRFSFLSSFVYIIFIYQNLKFRSLNWVLHTSLGLQMFLSAVCRLYFVLYLKTKILILRNILFNQRIPSSWSTVRICDSSITLCVREGNCKYVSRIERAGNLVHMAKFVSAALILLVLLRGRRIYKFRGYSDNEDQ
jgi:hypothetical protein